VPPFLNNSVLSRTDFDPTGAQYFSQWADVSYFLRPQGTVFTDNADGTVTPLPVFTLHRRARVLTPVPVDLGPAPTATPIQDGNFYRERFPDLSLRTEVVLTPGPGGAFGLPVKTVETWTNTPADMATPPLPGGTSLSRRMPLFVDWRNYSAGAPTPVLAPVGMPLPAGLAEVDPKAPQFGQVVNPERYGSDVLLNNVLSFQVRVLLDANTAFGNPNGTAFVDPPILLATGGRVYDTAASQFRIKAVQIRIRGHDGKNHQTRQVTITQDL